MLAKDSRTNIFVFQLITMKKILFLSIAIVLTEATLAQGNTASADISTSIASPRTKLPGLDKSPMDMAYFPTDYPTLKTQNKAPLPALMRVIYSRPQRDNRAIFGELVEYGKVWRMGANEATEIEFFKDALVGGKKVPKGRYTLYAIPDTSKWTMIINKDTDTWGAFVYDPKKDVLRTEVPVQKLPSPVEPLSMTFTKTDKGAGLLIAWDNQSVTLPIEIK
jgi:Protein of unknown function (DUF2911)